MACSFLKNNFISFALSLSNFSSCFNWISFSFKNAASSAFFCFSISIFSFSACSIFSSLICLFSSALISLKRINLNSILWKNFCINLSIANKLKLNLKENLFFKSSSSLTVLEIIPFSGIIFFLTFLIFFLWFNLFVVFFFNFDFFFLNFDLDLFFDFLTFIFRFFF